VHHERSPVLVAFSSCCCYVGFDLCFEGLDEHLADPLASDLVKIEDEPLSASGSIVVYAPHRCILPADVGASAVPFDPLNGRYTTLLREPSIHDFRLHLGRGIPSCCCFLP
jgi:hypothetical protein